MLTFTLFEIMHIINLNYKRKSLLVKIYQLFNFQAL